MNENLSRRTGRPRFPQILIADNSLSTVKSVIHSIADSQRDLGYEVPTQASEIESSRRALEEGAFDLIPTPLEREQTTHCERRCGEILATHGRLSRRQGDG